jgi:hypothetical protein
VPSYEFTGGDPIDHFELGRVEPGDVVEFDDEPGGPWKATKKRPRRAQSAKQPSTGAEHGSDVPDSPEEV